MNNGILSRTQDKTELNSCLCYSRSIKEFVNLTDIDKTKLGDKVWRYIDVNSAGTEVDKRTQQLLKELKQNVQDHGVIPKCLSVSWDKEVSTEKKNN